VVRLPLGFVGGLYDPDTGLTRFAWRDFDADTGRFTALDPLGKKGGDSDWYGYCVDDPVNRVDRWGLADAKVYLYEGGPFDHIGVSVGNSTVFGKYPDLSAPNDPSKGFYMNVPGVIREESPSRVPARTFTFSPSPEQEKNLGDFVGRSLETPQNYNIGNESCVGYGCDFLKIGGVDAPDGKWTHPQQLMDYLERIPPIEAPSDGFSVNLNTEKYEVKND